MTDTHQKILSKTLWTIADQFCGSVNADDFLANKRHLLHLPWTVPKDAT
jgi:hypothetical protein